MRMQKPVGFLCINNELAIKEIKKAIPYKEMKYLGLLVTRM